MSDETHASSIAGECRVFLAFEAGFAIDLARAAARFPASAREALPASRRIPADSDFAQKPLRVAIARQSIEIGRWHTARDLEATLYDFGAISIVATLGDAIQRPDIRAGAEDFVVFTVDPASCPPGAISIDALGPADLAALLRLEDGALSSESADDAVAQPLSYGPRDLVLVDWAAAVVVDSEPAATLAVLELANVQLVELKHLDGELDRGLDQVWAMANDRSLFARFRLRANLHRLAELELEGAALFDSVSNALKLFGDQHLARVQRAAIRRFRLDDWERSIARKLETVASISSRLESRQSQHRSELLEWIIILLIAFEIVRTFV